MVSQDRVRCCSFLPRAPLRDRECPRLAIGVRPHGAGGVRGALADGGADDDAATHVVEKDSDGCIVPLEVSCASQKQSWQ